MDGWMDGWANEWTDRGIEERTDINKISRLVLIY
jgi:hypothetical protein